MFGSGKKQCRQELERLHTQVRKAASELRRMTDAARAGQLDVRLDASQFDGDLAQIVNSVNDTLDTVVKPFQWLARQSQSAR